MKKGDYLESARHFRRWGVGGGGGEGALPTQEKKKKLIKSKFGINHPTLFFPFQFETSN